MHKLTKRECKILFFWLIVIFSWIGLYVGHKLQQVLQVPENRTILVESEPGQNTEVKIPSFVNNHLYTEEGILQITSYRAAPDANGTGYNLYVAYSFTNKNKRSIIPASVVLAYFSGSQLVSGKKNKLLYVKTFPENYYQQNLKANALLATDGVATGIFGFQLVDSSTPVIIQATDVTTGKSIGKGSYSFTTS